MRARTQANASGLLRFETSVRPRFPGPRPPRSSPAREQLGTPTCQEGSTVLLSTARQEYSHEDSRLIHSQGQLHQVKNCHRHTSSLRCLPSSRRLSLCVHKLPTAGKRPSCSFNFVSYLKVCTKLGCERVHDSSAWRKGTLGSLLGRKSFVHKAMHDPKQE